MIFDLHSDLLTSKLSANAQRQYLTHQLATGLRGIVAALYTTARGYTLIRAEELLCRFSDLPNVVCAVEDLDFAADTLDIVRLPFLTFTLTWNFNNRFAGGALDDGRLTSEGRSFLEQASRLGKVLDLAHLNQNSALDALDAFDGAVLNSHTCFDFVCAHKRNIGAMLIRRIIDRGGIIGLTLYRNFLGGGEEQVIRNINEFTERFGTENLAIGTDYFGADDIVESLNEYEKFGAFGKRLLAMGYTQAQIDAIFFKNAQEFFKKHQFAVNNRIKGE